MGLKTEGEPERRRRRGRRAVGLSRAWSAFETPSPARPRWPLGGGQSTKGPTHWRACLAAGDHPAEPGHLCGPGHTFAAPGSEPSEEGDGGQDVQLIPKIFLMGQKPRPLAGGWERSPEVRGLPAGASGSAPSTPASPASCQTGLQVHAQRLSTCGVLCPARPPSAVAPQGPRHGAGPLSSSAPLPGPPGRSEAVGPTIRAPSNEAFFAPLGVVCSTWI